MAKREIKYGNVDVVPEDAFEPKNTRVRISIMVPGDVLATLRERAARENKGYQTLTNEILRKHAAGSQPSGEAFLLLKEGRALQKRLDENSHAIGSVDRALAADRDEIAETVAEVASAKEQLAMLRGMVEELAALVGTKLKHPAWPPVKSPGKKLAGKKTAKKS